MSEQTDRIERIRLGCYAVLAITFLGTAAWVFGTDSIPPLPAWCYGAIGLGVAGVLYAVGTFAPRGAVEAVFDEGAADGWLRAQAFGFWVGVFSFATLGNLLGHIDLSVGAAFMGSSMLMGGAPFVYVLVGEWRRARG